MASGSIEVERRLSSGALRDLLAVVNTSRDLDEILNYLVLQAQQVLGSDAVSLYLRDARDLNLLRVKAAYGITNELLSPDAPVGFPIAGLPVTTQRCVVLADYRAVSARPYAERVEDQVQDRGAFLELVRAGPLSANDPAQREINQRLGATFRTIAAVPLVAHDEAYGSLLLYYTAPYAHGADKVDLSLAFAQQAALAIENAHLRAEAEQRLAEMERRRRVAEGLRDLLAVANSNPDLDDILAEVLAQSRRLLGNDAGVVYLRDTDESDVLRARAWLGIEPNSLALEIRVGEQLTGAGDGPLRAVVSTPLVAREREFGAIALYYAEPRTFSADEVDLVRRFVEQATQAIETARLHAEVERRMHENDRRRRVAEGMRDLLASVNSTRSLDEVLDLVLGQAAGVLGCDAGSILLLDDTEGKHAILTARASRALVAEFVPSRLPVGTAITGVAVERQRPVVVADLQDAVPVPGEPDPIIEPGPGYLKMLRIGMPPEGTRIREVAMFYRSILAVPLTVRGRVQGAITLYYQRPRDFSREELGLAEAFADQTALAVENARLHAQTVRRSRDLEALYRADEALYRSLDLQQVLQALVDVAGDVLEADMCSVLVWDELHERLVTGATRGLAEAEDIGSALQVPIKVNGELFGVFGVNYRQPRDLSAEEERVLLALAHRAALAIENAQLYTESERRRHDLEALYRADETLHSSLRLDDVLRSLVDVATDVMNADKISVTILDPDVATPPLQEIIEREGIRTALAAPIMVAGLPFGIFSVAFCADHVPTSDERRLAQALAQRAGLAIQNARLFEQAQQVATASERQRLARELHDAVTQTLFSASLIADVLPRLWARNPDQGRQRLEELRQLTRGALGEMRTLLLELRPTALVETPFGRLLNQLADSLSSRTTVQIEVHAAADERPLPPEVQVALYRIAQEALNNVVKHAAAKRAEVQFRRRGATVDLEITDDGRGFDYSTTPPGHLGLRIMRERAGAISAQLHVESHIGSGTRIAVRWRGITA